MNLVLWPRLVKINHVDTRSRLRTPSPVGNNDEKLHDYAVSFSAFRNRDHNVCIPIGNLWHLIYLEIVEEKKAAGLTGEFELNRWVRRVALIINPLHIWGRMWLKRNDSCECEKSQTNLRLARYMYHFSLPRPKHQVAFVSRLFRPRLFWHQNQKCLLVTYTCIIGL